MLPTETGQGHGHEGLSALPSGAVADCSKSASGSPLRGPAQVIRDHFDGDEALYFAFRASCLKQFADDIDRGNAAVHAADLDALRRLAHDLRSVLLTLDETVAAECATQLECRLLAGDCGGGLGLWGALRSELLAIGAPR